MIETFIASLASVIVATIQAGGYLGVALLMGIESACVPLPSEIIMPFAGSLVPAGRFSLAALATAGALGCNLGSTLAYLVGAYGGRPAVDRWGRYVLLTHGDVDWSEHFFKRYGSVAVFLSRLLPVVRTFIALPAGIARMPMLRFQAYTFAGSWLWCFGLAFVGAKLGEAWDRSPTLRTTFHRLDAVVLGIGVIAAALFIRHRLRAPKTGGSSARLK